MELPSTFFFFVSWLMQLAAHPPSPSLPHHLPCFYSSLSTFLRTFPTFEKDRAQSLSIQTLPPSFQAGLSSDAALCNFLLTSFRLFLATFMQSPFGLLSFVASILTHHLRQFWLFTAVLTNFTTIHAIFKRANSTALRSQLHLDSSALFGKGPRPGASCVLQVPKASLVMGYSPV